MSKRSKVILSSIFGLALTVALAVFIFPMGIRREFSNYLKTKYPELTFKIGLPRYTLLYGSYYADATCVNDSTTFRLVSQRPRAKTIGDTYEDIKRVNQYNSKLNNIFQNRDIKNHILSITGGSQSPFTNDAAYEQVGIHLTNDVGQASVIKTILTILNEEDISVERIIFRFDDIEHLYEVHLTSSEFDLTEKEIESKIVKIK